MKDFYCKYFNRNPFEIAIKCVVLCTFASILKLYEAQSESRILGNYRPDHT